MLEICNLEEAHFVQYKPGNIIYEEEFQITKVFRDRKWFENNVKYMIDFVNTLQYVKNNQEIKNMFKEDDQIRFIHTLFKYNKKTRMFRKKTRKPIQMKQIPEEKVYTIDLSILQDHVQEFIT